MALVLGITPQEFKLNPFEDAAGWELTDEGKKKANDNFKIKCGNWKKNGFS